MKLRYIVVALACCTLMRAQSRPEPKPDVAGVTLDSKGKPLRKTDLTLVSLETNAVGDPMPAYSAVSENGGKFEFYGVPPGRYRLMADHAGYLRTRYGAKAPWAPGTVFTLRHGFPITGLEIRMPEQAVISGKVEHDGPAGTLMVALLQEQFQDGKRRMAVINTTTVELNGEFRFNRLTPGRYYLVARPATLSASDAGLDEEIGIPTFYPGKPDQSAAEPVVLQEGQSVSANFSVLKSRCYRVSGSVGPFPPGSRVAVSLRSSVDSVVPFSSSAVVEPDGTFQIKSVPPGPYVLITSVQGGPEPRIAQQSIDVRADVAGVFVKPDVSAAALQGSLKIEGGSGAPLRPRLMLRAIPPAIQSAGAQVGPDGTFKFGPLLPGRYRLQLMEELPPGAYLKSAKFGDQDALSNLDITQPSADARLDVVVSYAAAGINGVILDEDGKPAEGTAALIPDPPQPEQQWLYRVAEAGEGGRFKFQGVRPRKYRLYAWEELEPGSHMDPEVTASRVAYSVSIELNEKESKTVTVKRIAADAAPPPAR